MDITFGMMFNQMAGIFVLLLLGYGMNRYHVLPPEAESVLSKISTKLLLPALMLYTFIHECTLENFLGYSGWMLCGTVFLLISVVLAILLVKPIEKKDAYLASVYRYSIVFPNTAGVGTPIVMALFGSAGLFQYQMYQLMVGVLCYSWGLLQLQPTQNRGGWKKALRNLCNPVLIAVFAGALLGISGIGERLPEAIHTTLKNLGSCYSVIALILTGFVIGNYNLKDMFGNGWNYAIALLRLIVMPGVFLIVLSYLQVPDMLRILTCLTYACPCGMNTVVFPTAYGQDARPGASLVLITSTLAVFTVPLLFAFM